MTFNYHLREVHTTVYNLLYLAYLYLHTYIPTYKELLYLYLYLYYIYLYLLLILYLYNWIHMYVWYFITN